MDNITRKNIEDDINERMKKYTHSMQPTNDEVSIAYLLCEISRLEEWLEWIAAHTTHDADTPDSTFPYLNMPPEEGAQFALSGESMLDRSEPTTPTRKEETPVMRLYAWQPTGHGEQSFFVMAESEEKAKAAVEAEISRMLALEEDERYYDLSDFYGWGSDYYQLTVANEGQVITNDNE